MLRFKQCSGFLFLLILLPAPTLVRAEDDDEDSERIVNCGAGQSLQRRLASADPGDTIRIRGTCNEAITIVTDHLTLDGEGSARLEGAGRIVITVDAVQGVTLRNLTVAGGSFGVLATRAAGLSIIGTTVENHAATGVRVEDNSSLVATDSTIRGNGLNGLEVENGSQLRVSGQFVSRGNAVFGLFVNNNSSLTLATAEAEVSHNILGIQVGVNSSIFLADAATSLNTSNNLTTGLTVVSGSNLFVFEGSIVSDNNRFNHGVSANSDSTIDLDRGGSITARRNGLDGIQLEDSLLNMFNMPGFAGSTVLAANNGRHGVSGFLTSRIDLSVDSVISSQNNGAAGVLVDNGSVARLINSTLTGNTAADLVLSFGARGDLSNNAAIGTVICDASVLIRGDGSVVCPSP